MGDRARDNLRSSRPREEIVRDDELRLLGQMLRAYLDTGAYEQAIRCFQQIMNDPKASPRTKRAAATAITANAARIMERGPAVQIDARSQQLTIADLARLAPGVGPMGLEVPNSGSAVSPALRPGDPAPTADLQDMHRLLELEFPTSSESCTEFTTRPVVQSAAPSAAPEVLRRSQTDEGDAEGAG